MKIFVAKVSRSKAPATMRIVPDSADRRSNVTMETMTSRFVVSASEIAMVRFLQYTEARTSTCSRPV